MKKNFKFYIGVDLGGTTTKIGILDENGKIILFNEKATDISNFGANILDNISKQIDELLEEAKISKESIAKIGIGVPGPVKSDGTVEFALNLGWKEKFNIQDKLQELTNLPVKSANDATLSVLGEAWLGSAKGIQNVAIFTLGTGIGGGIVTNGKVVYGVNGEAGEFGHIPVCGKILKQRCKCGNIGCLEQYASAKGIVNLAKQLAKNLKEDCKEFSNRDSKVSNSKLLNEILEDKNISSKDIWDAVKEKDYFAIEIVNIFADKMAKAIDMIQKINDPEVIIIGGGMVEAGKIILDYINRKFEEKYKSTFSSPKIVLATLGNKAGTYGAARLAMQDN